MWEHETKKQCDLDSQYNNNMNYPHILTLINTVTFWNDNTYTNKHEYERISSTNHTNLQ